MVKTWKYVKTKGGKRVKRYVEILKNGKWKFLKSPKGSKSSKAKTSKSKSRVKSKSKGGGRVGSRRSNILGTVFKFLRVGAFIAPGVVRYQQSHGTQGEKALSALKGYAGIDAFNKFSFDLVGKMWLPFIATSAMTYLVPKMNGIIRRM